MGYVSIGMGDRFGALLMSLMALQLVNSFLFCLLNFMKYAILLHTISICNGFVDFKN